MPGATFPDALRREAPGRWYHLAAGALHFAAIHARRGDAAASIANLGQVILATAQGRLAEAGEWALNEKRIVARAGLGDVQALLGEADLDATIASVGAVLDLPPWP